MDASDFVGIALFLVLIGFFAYCMAPAHWQTPLGFALIVLGIVPALLIVLALLAQPAIIIPAAFIIGCLLVPRRRR